MSAPFRRLLPWVSVILFGGASPLLAAPADSAWQEDATFLFTDAYQSFHAQQNQPGTVERERLLGEAVSRLNMQPRTSDNLARAQASLESLIAANPSDQAGIFAQYFLGRFYQSYADPAQPDAARRLYRKLLDAQTGNVFAEAAAIPLVLSELYDNIPPAERSRRFAQLESIGPLLKTPSGRRDYHVTLGFAYVGFEVSPAKAIEHLVAADGEGITDPTMEANVWVAIGELARAQKQVPLATTYYGKFLAKYQRDDRCYTIKQRLAGLQTPDPAKPAP